MARPLVADLGSWLYQRVPFARPAMASAWGYRLRCIRYSEATGDFMVNALRRETWTAQQWSDWHNRRLLDMLRYAATSVPYYRRYWQQRRLQGDQRSWLDLNNWPILERQQLREHAADFLADGVGRSTLYLETTSGTTGGAVPIWQSRRTIQEWYALAELRWRGWYGVSRADRWAMLGSQMVAPQDASKPPYWVFNRGLNQLYMSTCHLSPATAADYVQAWRDYRIRYVWGHSSALYTLASAVLRYGIKVPGLRFVLSSSEPFPRWQREIVVAAFQAPAYETYGMTEKAAAASECSHGRLHLWPDTGFYEVVDGQQPVSRGAVGDLVTTTLIHDAMPLIRYRVGDMVRIDPDGAPCGCGRTLPVLSGVLGRTSDALVCEDGRVITPSSLEVIFDADMGIHEGQIIQEDRRSVRVLYVPGRNFGPSDKRLVERRIRERMGPVVVRLEAVDSIPRGPNGKFQAVKSLVPRPSYSTGD